jgi:tetratricopeptide (TPR) repeat protein
VTASDSTPDGPQADRSPFSIDKEQSVVRTSMTSGVEPPPADLAVKVAQVRNKLREAEQCELASDAEQALAIARQACADSEQLNYPPVHAEALVQVARAYDGWQMRTACAQARPLYEEALEIAEAAGHAQLVAVILRRLVELVLRLDSTKVQAKGYLDKLERAIARIRPTLGASHPDVIVLRTNYGLALKSQGNHELARTELAAALAGLSSAGGEASLDGGILHTYLSDVAYEQNDPTEALGHGNAALEIYQHTEAPPHRRAEAYTNIGNAEFKRKNYVGALAAYEAALEIRLPHLGNEHFQLGVNQGSIAETLAQWPGGDKDKARGHLNEARRILARVLRESQAVRQWLDSVDERLAA